MEFGANVGIKLTPCLSRPKAQSTWNYILKLKKMKANCLSRPKAQSTWNNIQCYMLVIMNLSQSPEGSIYMEFGYFLVEILEKNGLSRPKAQSTWNENEPTEILPVLQVSVARRLNLHGIKSMKDLIRII